MVLVFFLFGLAIGSFLNVVALRLNWAGELNKTSGLGAQRSYCPHCHKTLSWYELIPVLSFIIQGGRCRSCHAKISWQYPIVELATGIVFALLASQFWPMTTTWSFVTGITSLLIIITLILIAAIDARLYIIPDSLNIFLAILGIVLMVVDGAYASRLLAAVGGVAFFGALVLFSRGNAMGMGDVKLAGAMGLFLGWPNILVATFLAFIIGAIFGIILIILKRKAMKDVIPFGPFLVIGTLLAMFFNETIIGIITW